MFVRRASLYIPHCQLSSGRCFYLNSHVLSVSLTLFPSIFRLNSFDYLYIQTIFWPLPLPTAVRAGKAKARDWKLLSGFLLQMGAWWRVKATIRCQNVPGGTLKCPKAPGRRDETVIGCFFFSLSKVSYCWPNATVLRLIDRK